MMVGAQEARYPKVVRAGALQLCRAMPFLKTLDGGVALRGHAGWHRREWDRKEGAPADEGKGKKKGNKKVKRFWAPACAAHVEEKWHDRHRCRVCEIDLEHCVKYF